MLVPVPSGLAPLPTDCGAPAWSDCGLKARGRHASTGFGCSAFPLCDFPKPKIQDLINQTLRPTQFFFQQSTYETYQALDGCSRDTEVGEATLCHRVTSEHSTLPLCVWNTGEFVRCAVHRQTEEITKKEGLRPASHEASSRSDCSRVCGYVIMCRSKIGSSEAHCCSSQPSHSHGTAIS